MSAGGFLKSLGKALTKVGAISAEIAGMPFIAQLLAGNPKVGAAVGTFTADLHTIFGLVTIAEMAFADSDGKNGPEKLKIAGPAVRSALLLYAQSNLPGKGKIRDAAKVSNGANMMAAGAAEFLEGLEPVD